MTAPLTTGADLVEDELVVIPDEPTIIPDPAPSVLIDATDDATSIWRDPMLPFLALGTAMLLAMLVVGFFLSA